MKNDEDRKQNLEKYHKNHQEVRKGLQETLESAVENQEKWVPCARLNLTDRSIGKTQGCPRWGRHCPEDVAKAIHMRLWRCPHRDADLSDRPAYVSHTHIFTDLENVQWPGQEYQALTLMNTMLVIYRVKCPDCQVWVYPDSGPLKYIRYGLNLVCLCFRFFGIRCN